MTTENEVQTLIHRVIAHSETKGSQQHFMLALALAGGSATFAELEPFGINRRTAGRLAVVLQKAGEISLDIPGAPTPTRLLMELQCPTDCKGFGGTR